MKQVKPAPVKRRNPLHDALYMKKGGVHEKTNKAKRKIAHMRFKKEWCSQ